MIYSVGDRGWNKATEKKLTKCIQRNGSKPRGPPVATGMVESFFFLFFQMSYFLLRLGWHKNYERRGVAVSAVPSGGGTWPPVTVSTLLCGPLTERHTIWLPAMATRRKTQGNPVKPSKTPVGHNKIPQIPINPINVIKSWSKRVKLNRTR